MKNLELENFGVQEMNAKEMEEIDGGLVPWAIWVAAAAAIATYDAVTDFAKGFEKGFNRGH